MDIITTLIINVEIYNQWLSLYPREIYFPRKINGMITFRGGMNQ